MAARNADSMTNAQGQFQPRRPRDEPLTTHGHKPGVKASPKDQVEEFGAKTLPPGSAPPDRTFRPNAQTEVPGQADNDAPLQTGDEESTYTSAEDTLGGATSADLNNGLGHPGAGETSTELRHDGKHGGKREGALDGRATGGSDLRDEGSAEARRLARDSTDHGPRPAREHNATLEGAEDKMPTSSEEVANMRE